MGRFEIGSDAFLLDEQPFRVISGAMHYFRVHPAQWRERIRLARTMGLNTIETYVPWNAHEPEPGVFVTDDPRLGLRRFLELIAEEGMYAIVRPGPYICAEWDGGGLPAWLLADPDLRMRTSDPRFLEPASRFLRHVLAQVAPLQVDNGGPVILVQVENEYGAYGRDKEYLKALTDVTRESGITVPLITVDQPADDMIADGSLPELHKTASFGSHAAERLAHLREKQPTGPLMCGEFWCGWFDHWGAHHHTTSAQASAAELDALLAAGASVNIYMVHGGTNFGFTNGANDKGVYQPITTSYDYDAPIDEAGRPTEKFWAFRDVIAKYAPVPDVQPADAAAAPVFEVPLRGGADVLTAADALAAERGSADAASSGTAWTSHTALPTMEDLGVYRGLLAYRTSIDTDAPALLSFAEVRDRAIVLVDGARVGVLARERHESALVIPAGREVVVIVEDEGRVDYGSRIGERKGLIGPATLDGVALDAWDTLELDVDALVDTTAAGTDPAATSLAPGMLPTFHHAEFELAEPADLFLSTDGWGKGLAWVNGFALGRYWSAGPQHTLYVPRGATRSGSNDLVVLELDALAAPTARFVAGLSLGHTEE
ncbi:beta-galactosidase [Planctomonas sp. JC2975]|uniref:glycoside hydrolase family 35 protein n=1 Tax=Planctomonas sp. JC2975 TaxID=2729626 RepID=UPI0014729398|nr:beta-galactosidase family protein [Planctomonas sp. JC2975]NNC12513.1 beta-galactosidase [Planctomonas sp. JC2975]